MKTRWIAAAGLAALTACGSQPAIPRPDLSTAEEEVARAVEEASRAVARDPASASAWAALADRLHAHRWTDEAATAYAEAERLEPDAFLWPYLSGVAIEASNPAAAAAAFERALALDPAYAPAHVRLARCLAREGHADIARDHLERALFLDPSSRHASLALAQLDLQAGDLERARRRLAALLAEAPRFGEAQHAMAQVQFALGDDEAAAAHAELADGLPARTPLHDPRAERPVEPAGSIAHLERALKHVRDGQPEDALRQFEAAVAINPDNATAHFDMANLLARLGRFSEAELHYREAIRIRSADVEARYGLAVVLARSGSLDAAGEALAEALRLDPTNDELRRFAVDLSVRRGRAAEASGDPAAAERHYRAALAYEPADPAATFALGTLLARARRLEEAAILLSTAVAADPTDADALVNLALVEVKLDRLESARGHFESALRWRPGHPQGRRGLADCRARLAGRSGGD